MLLLSSLFNLAPLQSHLELLEIMPQQAKSKEIMMSKTTSP